MNREEQRQGMLESEYIAMENKLFPIKGIKYYIKKLG